MARTKLRARKWSGSKEGRNNILAGRDPRDNGDGTFGLKKKKSKNNSVPMETTGELYTAALTLVEQSQPKDALKKAKQLWTQVENRGAAEALPALNLLGEISVELGDVDSARAYFEKAVLLDPHGKIPETMGGGAEKFLWLAQLSEEGGEQSLHWYEKGVKSLQMEIAALESGNFNENMDQDTLVVMRMEKKRKLANALCSIVEVYMTDLSWEDDAEVRCENLVTEAMTVEDEPSAEVLQTLASVRLSQDRKEDAQAALTSSMETWKDLEPDDPAVPDFPDRISLSRLLMEADMRSEAMSVLNWLVQEDDQSIEAWYLGGWCQYLIADALNASKNDHSRNRDEWEDPEPIEARMKGSRHWLKTSMKLYDLLEYEDERLYDHASELVTSLDKILGPENGEAESDGDGEGDEEEWNGVEDEIDDEEMNDVP